VIAESLLLKHQLLVLGRSRKNAPILTPWHRLLFGIRADLQRKLGRFASHYNEGRVHSTLAGQTPSEQRGRPIPPIADLRQFSWQENCHGLVHTPIAGLARLAGTPLAGHCAGLRL
jgi:hypothetical protein